MAKATVSAASAAVHIGGRSSLRTITVTAVGPAMKLVPNTIAERKAAGTVGLNSTGSVPSSTTIATTGELQRMPSFVSARPQASVPITEERPSKIQNAATYPAPPPPLRISTMMKVMYDT